MGIEDCGHSLEAIERAEFVHRRKELADRLTSRGLSGAIAFGRQGTASTRAGYVLYLSNYFTPFFDGLEDCAPHWTALGNAAVVVSASGDALLVTDMAHYYFDSRGPRHAGVDVVHDTNVVRGIAKAARMLGIGDGKVGLIGEEILSVKRYGLLQSMMPGLDLVWHDALLDDAMMIKSEAELRILRYANKVVDEIASQALARAVPGVTEHELVDFVRHEIAQAGGELFWMRPNRLTPLRDGDIFFMSIVAWFQGYFVDVARNGVVGRAASDRQDLVGFLNEYILAQARMLKPGMTAEEAAAFGYKYFTSPKANLRREQIEKGALCPFPAFGHGIGLSFGKPYIREGDLTILRPGMVIAIEANYELADVGVAEAEVTVEIARSGPVLLSGLQTGMPD